MPADALPTVTSEGKWYTAFSRYETPSVRKAAWQLINTFVPYVGLWGVMGFLVLQGYPYWATLAFTVPAAALLIRIFIFFHDCCHGSFLAPDRANRIVGTLCGFLTFARPPNRGYSICLTS